MSALWVIIFGMGAPVICILTSFPNVSSAITHGLVIGTLCNRQLPRPLVALILQYLRMDLKLHGYHFIPFIFFPLGFSFTRSSWPNLQRKEMVSPLLRGFGKAFQPRLFLHSAWESNKGDLHRSRHCWATAQATVDRSWRSPLTLIALPY